MHGSFLCDELNLFLPLFSRCLWRKRSWSFHALLFAARPFIFLQGAEASRELPRGRTQGHSAMDTASRTETRILGNFRMGPHSPWLPAACGFQRSGGTPLLSMHPIPQNEKLDNPPAQAWNVRIPTIRGVSSKLGGPFGDFPPSRSRTRPALLARKLILPEKKIVDFIGFFMKSQENT